MRTLTPPAATAAPTDRSTTEPSLTRTTPRPRRRGCRVLTAAAVALSLTALGACTSNSGGDAGPSTGSVAGTTSAPTTSTTSAAPTTTAPPARVDKKVKVKLTDKVLGHTITTSTLSRNVPWPAGNPVAAQQFEIVGVKLTVDAGDRYSAQVKPSMFTLKAGSAAPVKATDEFAKKFGTALAVTKRAKKKSGWLFFKLDRGAGADLKLIFNRPAYKVSTTGKSIKADTISKSLR